METTGNIARASLAALLFIGAWGASSHALGADTKAPGAEGVLMKQEYQSTVTVIRNLPRYGRVV